jgi:hypothetical protein
MNANPTKVSMKDNGGNHVNTAQTRAAKMIIAIEGNRNFCFFLGFWGVVGFAVCIFQDG